MKRYLFLAWFGLILFMLFMAYASWCLSDMVDINHWRQGRLQAGDIFPFLLCVSFVGLPFMFMGGLHANPRYFWCACIIIGLVYLILIVIYKIIAISLLVHGGPSFTLLFVGIPGYLSIGLGIGLKRMVAKGNA
jgi:hypothetical protein